GPGLRGAHGRDRADPGLLPDRAGVGDQRAQARARPADRHRAARCTRRRRHPHGPQRAARRRRDARGRHPVGDHGHDRARPGTRRLADGGAGRGPLGRRRPPALASRLTTGDVRPRAYRMTVTRVLIVDDDSFARTMICSILTAQQIEVVGEASDGDEVPAAVAEHRPDIVLVDLQMRRVDGVEAIRRNAALPGAPRFVALTGYGTEDAVLRAIQAGAAGFLSKDDDPATLAGHLRAVAEGGGALGPDAAALVIQRMTTAPETHDRVAEARA